MELSSGIMNFCSGEEAESIEAIEEDTGYTP